MEHTTKKIAKLACWALLASRSASQPGLPKGMPFNSTSSGTAGNQLTATSALQMPLPKGMPLNNSTSISSTQPPLPKGIPSDRTSIGTVAGGQLKATSAPQPPLENGVPSKGAIPEEVITHIAKATDGTRICKFQVRHNSQNRALSLSRFDKGNDKGENSLLGGTRRQLGTSVRHTRQLQIETALDPSISSFVAPVATIPPPKGKVNTLELIAPTASARSDAPVKSSTVPIGPSTAPIAMPMAVKSQSEAPIAIFPPPKGKVNATMELIAPTASARSDTPVESSTVQTGPSTAPIETPMPVSSPSEAPVAIVIPSKGQVKSTLEWIAPTTSATADAPVESRAAPIRPPVTIPITFRPPKPSSNNILFHSIHESDLIYSPSAPTRMNKMAKISSAVASPTVSMKPNTEASGIAIGEGAATQDANVVFPMIDSSGTTMPPREVPSILFFSSCPQEVPSGAISIPQSNSNVTAFVSSESSSASTSVCKSAFAVSSNSSKDASFTLHQSYELLVEAWVTKNNIQNIIDNLDAFVGDTATFALLSCSNSKSTRLLVSTQQSDNANSITKFQVNPSDIVSWNNCTHLKSKENETQCVNVKSSSTIFYDTTEGNHTISEKVIESSIRQALTEGCADSNFTSLGFVKCEVLTSFSNISPMGKTGEAHTMTNSQVNEQNQQSSTALSTIGKSMAIIFATGILVLLGLFVLRTRSTVIGVSNFCELEEADLGENTIFEKYGLDVEDNQSRFTSVGTPQNDNRLELHGTTTTHDGKQILEDLKVSEDNSALFQHRRGNVYPRWIRREDSSIEVDEPFFLNSYETYKPSSKAFSVNDTVTL